MKRLIGVVLIVIMVIASFPAVTTRAEDKDVITFSSKSGTLTPDDVSKKLENLEEEGVEVDDKYTARFDESVTIIGYQAFRDCDGLKSVEISDHVTSIERLAFDYCSYLTSVTISDNVINIDDTAFWYCKSLVEIIVSPSNPVYSSDDDGVLFSKDKKTLIICPEGKSGEYSLPDSVETINKTPLCNCSRLLSINVSPNNQYFSSKDGVVFNKDQSKLILCPSGRTDKYIIPEGVIEIDNNAFYFCSFLTEIEIPDSVKSIGSYAFCGCYNLMNINIPDRVTIIRESVFERCMSITKIELPDSITSIGSTAFNSCYQLTDIKIPVNVASIGTSAFLACTSLTSIEIPCGMTIIESFTFQHCTNLTNIVIPNNVTYIKSHAFSDCPNLINIDLGNCVERLGGSVFSGSSIRTIRLPPSLKSFVTSIPGVGLLTGMTYLENIVFEHGTEEIAAYVFKDITDPINIYIPKTVTSIRKDSYILDTDATIYGFAGSYAERYATIDNGIPFVTLPTVVADELPMGYQYLPYSFSFASSEGSYLEVVEGTLPLGLQISTSTIGNRTQGEIWGAPLEAGRFTVKVRATDGNTYLLEDDEVTFEIIIEPERAERWWPELREDLILERLQDYIDPFDDTSVIEVYDSEPDSGSAPGDKRIKIKCEYDDFIALWIDGKLMTRGDKAGRTGDYFVEEGSTAVTIYRKTLAESANVKEDPDANHVIAAEFKVNGSPEGEQYKVAQTFKIRLVPCEYRIIYNLNGGINAASNPDIYFTENTPITLANPTKSGFDFIRWIPDNKIPSGSTGNRTFTAEWSNTPIIYKITYDLNGGTNTSNPSTYTVESATITLADPTRTGHDFVKWIPDNKIPSGSTGDREFKAEWSKIADPNLDPNLSPTPSANTEIGTPGTPSEIEPVIIQTRYYDVATTDWFYDDVEYVSEKGLMVGTGPRIFSPHIAMSRAMLITVLYRLEGEPEVNSESGISNSKFTDIVENAWYYNAVIWAANNGIVEGYGSEVFGLNDPVTREQTVAILYRYAIMKELNVSATHDLSGYTDTDEISDWALDAMKWAVAEGIIRGRTTTTTEPKGTSTRAEVTAVFNRFVQARPALPAHLG